MKILIVLVSCLCGSLAITVHYETTGAAYRKTKENEDKLKDIRLVAVAEQSESLQSATGAGRKKGDMFKAVQRARENPKTKVQVPRLTSGGHKKKQAIERVGTSKQNVPIDPNQQHYMQKVANQLFMAQKHASLLSDYQKFILNQDQNVKNFVLGQTVQERNPKPFSRRTKQAGRALAATAKYEPVTAANVPLQKIVVVTPKVQTAVQKKPQQQQQQQQQQRQNDHSAQAAHVKYVTLAPQSLTHYVEPQQVPRKVTLLPYHSQQQPYTYYDFGVTGKPQVEPVQIPSTLSLNLGTFEDPQYHDSESEDEDSVHHESTKYEFMYKVKDHEKNSDFGHKESRTDKTTYGFYYVHLPDGRLETVKYWADKTGYHAKVHYEGEAKHPPHSDHKYHTHNHY